MTWKSFDDGVFQEFNGQLGHWALRRLTDEGAQVSFAPAGTRSFMARVFATFGSMAEARLAVAIYEDLAARNLTQAITQDTSIEDLILAAGFKLDASHTGTTRDYDCYVKPSEPGTLRLSIYHPKANSASGMKSLYLCYCQKNGIRWFTLAHMENNWVVDRDDLDEPGSAGQGVTWRPMVSGVDPVVLDFKVAVAIAEARMTTNQAQKTSLNDGEELPFIQDMQAVQD